MRNPKLSIRFFRSYRFLFLPEFTKNRLRWKDKFETPRCETPPSFRISWLWWGLYGIWEDDDYWEQWLWINEYNNGNEEEARKTWHWIDGMTKESTWKEYK
jgi:hypothetical protein